MPAAKGSGAVCEIQARVQVQPLCLYLDPYGLVLPPGRPCAAGPRRRAHSGDAVASRGRNGAAPDLSLIHI
ncbi:hypothetical protein, partial [Streptomyces sp. rh34]|uniref:hypothetical protein n=1 Tax=Streptomyces sp. rh34 TaxID=2034272 RepID=UPI00117CC6C4